MGRPDDHGAPVEALCAAHLFLAFSPHVSPSEAGLRRSGPSFGVRIYTTVVEHLFPQPNFSHGRTVPTMFRSRQPNSFHVFRLKACVSIRTLAFTHGWEAQARSRARLGLRGAAEGARRFAGVRHLRPPRRARRQAPHRPQGDHSRAPSGRWRSTSPHSKQSLRYSPNLFCGPVVFETRTQPFSVCEGPNPSEPNIRLDIR
jgi:hypothetical protein